MSTNITNQVAYLRTSREFPEEIKELAFQVSKSYIDIANAVNTRTIGIYAVNKSSITGDSWFLTSKKQQTLRQVYTFTSTGNIPHGINISSVFRFSPNSYGSFTDGTNYYGAIYASSTAIAGQVSFYITPTNIVVLAGGGAPTISSGIIVLEWLSQV